MNPSSCPINSAPAFGEDSLFPVKHFGGKPDGGGAAHPEKGSPGRKKYPRQPRHNRMPGGRQADQEKYGCRDLKKKINTDSQDVENKYKLASSFILKAKRLPIGQKITQY
ncbi:MAG: hypothetical protein ACO1O1_05510 [Adhaeribacter sp.]